MLLLWLSLAFLAGLAGGGTLPAGPFWLLLTGLVAILALLPFPRLRIAALILAALAVGSWRAPRSTVPGPGDLAYYVGLSVTLIGTVNAEPDIRDTGANYLLSAQTVRARGGIRPVVGELRLHTSSAVQIEYGDRVELTGRLRRPLYGPATAEVSYPRLIVTGSGASGFWAAIESLRQRLEKGIDAWLPEPEAALLIGIALGAGSASLGSLAPALVATGLIHLIAISGIKVALLAGTMYRLLRRLANRWIQLLLALTVLWGYVLLTGATPSGTRSAVMWSLAFLAVALGRGTVTVLSLSVAAAVMAGLDPALLQDTGFQLSVAGTLAIAVFAGYLDRRLQPLPDPWRSVFAVTLAAQIGTIPIVIAGFGVLSLSGPIANALVLPLLPFLVALGLLLGALAGVPSLAAPLAALAGTLLRAIIATAESLARVLPAPRLTPLATPTNVLYYGILLLLAYFLLRRHQWAIPGADPHPGREYAVAGVLGAALLAASILSGTSTSGTRLTLLGVDNAALLQAGGKTVLISGSGHPLEYLAAVGATLPLTDRTLDVVLNVDARGSPALGLRALLGHYRIGEVADVGVEYPSGTYASWRTALRNAHVPVFALRTGLRFRLGSVQILALGPDAPYSDPRDSIALLRIDLPRERILVIGAASVREQHEAVFRGVDLHADVLVHSGPLDPDFVQAVGARRITSADQPMSLRG